MNEAFDKRSVAQALICLVILLLSLGITRLAYAGGDQQQVCDVRADYALGMEDYPEAIRLHGAIVRRHPDDALARYHLGFAEGMMGNRTGELSEYQRAVALGMRNWSLFLNLGLVQLENGDLDAAADSLRRAMLLGEDHPESHYNLALVDERRGQFAEAEREMRASLRLDPSQPDALNALGVIYAEEGKTELASQAWHELLRERPDYAPALKNLSLVGGSSIAASGETAAVVLPPAAAVNSLRDKPGPHVPARETEPRPAQPSESNDE